MLPRHSVLLILPNSLSSYKWHLLLLHFHQLCVKQNDGVTTRSATSSQEMRTI